MYTTNTGNDPRALQRFIDPRILMRINNLDLVARITIDGFISGLHRTRFLGVSTEFAEHRGYTPGDDVRHIDWRLFARTDRIFVKTFEAETNADLMLVLDASGSMNYSSLEGQPTKFDYARFVGASLCHLGHRQRDRVGFLSFSDDVDHWIPPSGRHRDRIMVAMAQSSASGGSHLESTLQRLGERLRRRGIVVVISDFYADTDKLSTALQTLRIQGHDVVAIHILDPAEQDLSTLRTADNDGAMVVKDLESGMRMAIKTELHQENYQTLMSAHIRSLRKNLGSGGVQYDLFSSHEPLDALLFQFLNTRARLARVR